MCGTYFANTFKEVAPRARQSMMHIVLLLLSLAAMSTAQIEEIENRPLDGHKFIQGQSFRIECRAFTGQDFAIRLACPLAEFATGGLASTSCFENCGRPLCDQPSLNDCSTTLPELLVANCSRSVRQISPTAQEIVVMYTFNAANPRHSGSYMCQFKNMRSSSYIIVDSYPVTTVSTRTTLSTSTSTSTTASTTPTSTKTTSSVVSTTSRAGASSGGPTTISMATSTAEAKTTAITTASPAVSTSATTEKIYTLPPVPKTQSPPTRRPSEPTTSQAPILKSGGWFYASIIGTLSGADVILVCLLIFVGAAWLIGFVCIRCQVLTTRSISKQPTSSCCSALLCLGQQPQNRRQQKQQPPLVNGGLREFAEQERRRGATRLTAMSLNPPTAMSANSVSSGQVYAEPDGASYYSPDGGDGQLQQHPLVLAGGGGNGVDDAYYRLQQDFDDPLSRGGYGTNPRSTFFPRDQTGRHSFQNARAAARQRPGIPREMLLDGEDAEAEAAANLVAAAVDPVMTRDDFRRQMEEQRREIASLREQLRTSQLQLNQRASSATKQPQQQQQQQQQSPQKQKSPTSGDYDFLTRVTGAEALPPSPPPPPPLPQQQQELLPNFQLLPDDADLPPLPPPPVVGGADDSGNEVANRRGSLGQAYGTGQRY